MFQFGDDHCVYIIPARYRRLIREVLSVERKWVCHNAPHDVRAIDRHLDYETGLLPSCTDTFILGHLLDSRNKKEGGTGNRLEDLAIAHVDRGVFRFEKNLKAEFKQIQIEIPGEVYRSGPRKGTQKYRKAKLSEGWTLIPLHNETYLRYAGSDPLNTIRVWRHLVSVLRQRKGQRRLADFEHRVQRACDVLQRQGIRVDVEYTRKLAEEMVFDAESNEMWADWYGVPNINSTAQLSTAMLSHGAHLVERTKTGKLKVDNTVLHQFKYADGDLGALVSHVLAAKQLRKRKAAWLDAALEERDVNDKAHPTIKSLAARTARMSMSDIQLHNVPSHEKRIRQCFIADYNWHIFSVDYDQQEMRMAGALSGEPKIIQAAHDNFSIHKLTAETVFGKNYSDREYKFSKNLNFGWLFGGGAKTLAEQTGIDIETAASLVSRYNKAYPVMARWKRETTEGVLRDALSNTDYAMLKHFQRQTWDCDNSNAGKALKRALRSEINELLRDKTGVVVTPIGRRLIVDAIKAYRAVNYRVQSASRDMTAEGLVRIAESEHGKHALLVIHDEILGQGPQQKAQKIADTFAEIMSTKFMGVPFTAAGKVYGRSWGDGYKDE
ncbi:MAG: DNA polymerase [Candidatus Binatia bacterium]